MTHLLRVMEKHSFNDVRGRYLDNRIGKGRRHEFDPLGGRVEVGRTVVN